MAAVAIVLAIILIVTLFRPGRRDQSGDVFKALVESQDRANKAIERERDAWKQIAEERREDARYFLRRDSILSQTQTQNQKLYKPIDEKINRIPADISSIAHNDDLIRTEFSRHREVVD